MSGALTASESVRTLLPSSGHEAHSSSPASLVTASVLCLQTRPPASHLCFPVGWVELQHRLVAFMRRIGVPQCYRCLTATQASRQVARGPALWHLRYPLPPLQAVPAEAQQQPCTRAANAVNEAGRTVTIKSEVCLHFAIVKSAWCM